jgi:hypothetical protein
MYGKNATLGDEGIGIASDPQREINKLTYIQLDVSEIQDVSPNITIENIQEDGGFALYGSNKLGKMGDLLYTSSDSPPTQTISIPEIKSYKYISVTAAGDSIIANVLLRSIDFVI